MLSLKGNRFILHLAVGIFVIFDTWKSKAIHFKEIVDYSDFIVYGYLINKINTRGVSCLFNAVSHLFLVIFGND